MINTKLIQFYKIFKNLEIATNKNNATAKIAEVKMNVIFCIY